MDKASAWVVLTKLKPKVAAPLGTRPVTLGAFVETLSFMFSPLDAASVVQNAALPNVKAVAFGAHFNFTRAGSDRSWLWPRLQAASELDLGSDISGYQGFAKFVVAHPCLKKLHLVATPTEYCSQGLLDRIDNAFHLNSVTPMPEGQEPCRSLRELFFHAGGRVIRLPVDLLRTIIARNLDLLVYFVSISFDCSCLLFTNTDFDRISIGVGARLLPFVEVNTGDIVRPLSKLKVLVWCPQPPSQLNVDSLLAVSTVNQL